MKEAKRSSSGFTHRQSYKSKKTYSKPSSLSQTFLTPFSHKSIVLAIAFIIILIGSFALSQGPLFHDDVNNPQPIQNDPYNVIWSGITLSQFNTVVGSGASITSVTNCDGVVACLLFTAQASGVSSLTTIALSKTTVGDLSLANGKNLFIQMVESQTGTLCQNCEFGWYLTTNKTVPNTPNYHPYSDSSVLFIDIQDCTSACNFSSATIRTRIYLLRTIGNGETITGEESGCSSGSQFLCLSTNNLSTGTFASNNVILNYTGSSAGTACGTGPNPVNGPGCSSIAYSSVAGSQSTTQTLPWSNFQAQQLYFGIFVNPGPTNVNFDFVMDDTPSDAFSMNINLYTPLPPPDFGINTPQIDTGGFFGPIVKALISIAVFMAQNIINFMNFLNSIFAPLLATVIAIFGGVFVAVFNALGGIFGDNSLGTQMGTFLSNLSTYLTNAWSQQITFIGTVVNFLVNSFSVTSAFFVGTSAFIGLWTSLLSGIGALVGVLNTFLGTLLYFYNLGVFGFNIIIILLMTILCVSAVLDWIQTDNPLSGFIAVVLTFFLLFVLQTSNSSLNVVATNATILTQYQNAWNYTLFFVKLAPVLFFAMFIEWIAGLDETQRVVHGGQEFMPNFQSMLRFDIMLTTDIFKGGYWAFNQAYFIITAGITAIKGRWSPVEVAGTG